MLASRLPRFSLGCGHVHVQGCRDGHFVLASRLCAAPPPTLSCNQGLGLPPRPPGQLRWVPRRASFKKRHSSSFCMRGAVPATSPPEPKPLDPRPPSQPFPDPFPWNQGPWSTPPSTRPALVGTPQSILQKARCQTCSARALAPPSQPFPDYPHPTEFFFYALETTVPLPPTPPKPCPAKPTLP